jgi:hypothetical protein
VVEKYNITLVCYALHFVDTVGLTSLHRSVLQLEEQKLKMEIAKLEVETRVWQKLEARLDSGQFGIFPVNVATLQPNNSLISGNVQHSNIYTDMSNAHPYNLYNLS